jgi:Cu-processing system permease protein
MKSILLVASAVYRESVRDRVPLTIAGFGVVLVFASYLISQLTAGQDLKIIKDLGLAALNILGLFIAVFIGIGLVA